VNVKAFTFNELKMATRNFSPQTMLGEGSLGATYKGWIDETTLAPAKEGTGMVVAVKKLNENAYYMDHQEWLVSSIDLFIKFFKVYVRFALFDMLYSIV
jgi:hypothetical protein